MIRTVHAAELMDRSDLPRHRRQPRPVLRRASVDEQRSSRTVVRRSSALDERAGRWTLSVSRPIAVG